MIDNIIRKSKMGMLILKEVISRRNNKIKIHTTKETLEKIANECKSVARFGDSEFNLMFGNDLIYQKYSEQMAAMMKNVLCDKKKNNNCLVCIPYSFYRLNGFTAKSKLFWLKYFAKNRRRLENVLDVNYSYYDAQISRIYVNRSDKRLSQQYFNIWQKIWNDKNLLIVEGKLSRFGVGNSLLDNAKSIRRIICPSENAFDKYNEIKESILSTTGYDLVIISLGPTATLIAYELSLQGVWAIDSGNLDMEYEWMSRSAKRPIALDNKYTIEARNGTMVEECDDSKYISQIIKRIC